MNTNPNNIQLGDLVRPITGLTKSNGLPINNTQVFKILRIFPSYNKKKTIVHCKIIKPKHKNNTTLALFADAFIQIETDNYPIY